MKVIVDVAGILLTVLIQNVDRFSKKGHGIKNRIKRRQSSAVYRFAFGNHLPNEKKQQEKNTKHRTEDIPKYFHFKL